MVSVNRVILIGRLTRDPELRYTPSGTPVADFGLAMNRTYPGADGQMKEEATFVDVVVWRKQAETCAEYLRKGRLVYLEGRLELDTWETKEGERRNKIRVVAEMVKFLDRGPDREGGTPRRAAAYGPPERATLSEAKGKESMDAEQPPPENLDQGDPPF